MGISLSREIKCCITGQSLSENDNIVYFPMFLDEPKNAREQVEKYLTDPTFHKIYNCNEGCALRSAFEQWELHDAILIKAKGSLIQQAEYPPFRKLLWQDDSYLLQEISSENRKVMYFLKHLLTIDCIQNEWEIFYKQLETLQKEYSLYGRQHSLKFIHKNDHFRITKRLTMENMPYESVKLSLTEWQEFKSIVIHFFS